jgi:hyaluronan synthase
VWKHPFLAYTMVDKAVSGFTLLLGPIFMVVALVNHNWIFAVVLALWWQISRSAKLLPHIRRRPSSFFLVPGYVFVSWVMALIKIQALLTIRRQRWLTRQVAVENGEVVRTSGAGSQLEPEQQPELPPEAAAVDEEEAAPDAPTETVKLKATSEPRTEAPV